MSLALLCEVSHYIYTNLVACILRCSFYEERSVVRNMAAIMNFYLVHPSCLYLHFERAAEVLRLLHTVVEWCRLEGTLKDRLAQPR